MALEAGLKVDRDGFEKLIVEHKDKSRQNQKKINVLAIQGNLPATDDSAKFSLDAIEATVLGWVKANKVVTDGKLLAGEQVALLLDSTNYYGEQGGQVGDAGIVKSEEGGFFEVEDTQRLGDSVLHIGELKEGRLKVGDKVQVVPATRRFDIMRNHTATHLLNLSLRRILGSHVDQKGSLVDSERTRFDFSHDKPLSAEEIRRIEEDVNNRIMDDVPVTARIMPLAEAKKLPGVRAVFGEKYPDPVRVVLIADDPDNPSFENSVEFCGGTHLESTAPIGLFKILSQEASSKGVRRLVAVSGRSAFAYFETLSAITNDLSSSSTARFTNWRIAWTPCRRN